MLYLSPGLSDKDLIDARSKAGQQSYVLRRSGRKPLGGGDKQSAGWKWWTSRARIFGDWHDLQTKIAILNIGAYHSKSFADAPLLAALPSSRVSLDWAQTVLFPEAVAGTRVVICLRAARFWGLKEGRR